MRTASVACINYLNANRKYKIADLYTITLIGGTVIRTTNMDVPITIAPNTFSPRPAVIRQKTRVVIGVEVDTLDIVIMPKPTELLGGVTWHRAAREGALDGARILVERCVLIPTGNVQAPYDTSNGTIVWWGGRFGAVTVTRTGITAVAKSDLLLLDRQVPNAQYQKSCRNTVYDGRCGVSRASFTQSTTARSGSTISVVNTNCSYATGDGDLGVLKFITGNNAGQSRSIKSYTNSGAGGVCSLITPFYYAAAAGDQCQVTKGCDRSKATCSGRFSNLARFVGEPDIPMPEVTR